MNDATIHPFNDDLVHLPNDAILHPLNDDLIFPSIPRRLRFISSAKFPNCTILASPAPLPNQSAPRFSPEAMAYVQGGDVRAKRSPWRLSIIREMFLGLLNFLLDFFKTMFSLDAHENYGKAADNGRPGGPTRPAGGVGRAPGSSAPRGINNVHTLFGSSGTSGASGDHGNVHVMNSARSWQTKVNEAKTARKVIVVDFTASWCGPCKLMAPVFAELSRKFGQLVFVKVDVDEVQEVAAQYEVRAMPTFLFIKDGQQIDKVVGADKNELERKCNRYGTSR